MSSIYTSRHPLIFSIPGVQAILVQIIDLSGDVGLDWHMLVFNLPAWLSRKYSQHLVFSTFTVAT